MFGVGVGIRVGGRTPVGGSAYDADAQAFFTRVATAGGTLTTTEQNATNQLVLDMKAAGIWTAMRAVYPMVGASAAACAQNLKSSSFTGTFTSGWTFASTGVTPNGTSAYMDTGMTPNANLSNSSACLTFYSRTNINQATYDFAADQYSLLLYANTFYVNLTAVGAFSATFALSNTTGYYIASRVNSTNVNGYRNGTKVINNAVLASTLNSQPLVLSARSTGSGFSSKQCAFATVSDGLDDTQSSNLYTAVQAFQTTLGRQVV